MEKIDMILRHRKEQKLRDWTNRFWRLRWKNGGNSIMNTLHQLPFNSNQVDATSNFNGWKLKAMSQTLAEFDSYKMKNLFSSQSLRKRLNQTSTHCSKYGNQSYFPSYFVDGTAAHRASEVLSDAVHPF